MSSKTVNDIDVKGKNVLCRLDLDVPVTDGKITDDTRLLGTESTVRKLIDGGAKNITVIGHLGRPGSNSDIRLQISNFQMDPIRAWYKNRFPEVPNLVVADNLRFNPGEEANNLEFAKHIVRQYQAQIYVFDAFASYRHHASVVTVPKLLPTATGFRLEAELAHLSSVFNSPARPVVVIIGGAKADTKLTYLSSLSRLADTILVGGKLPQFSESLPKDKTNAKLVIAPLTPDGLDITRQAAKLFEDTIIDAGTVVWNGPVGAYENNPITQYTNKPINQWQTIFKNTPAYGTYMVAKAMNQTKAYTVAGGGDTEAALKLFGLESGIDWISAGGGAMLYYLAYHTLPFLEAIKG